MKNGKRKILSLGLVIFAITGLYILLHGFKEEYEYVGIVYPDASDLSQFREIGPFQSLEECEKTAEAAAGSSGDSECEQKHKQP